MKKGKQSKRLDGKVRRAIKKKAKAAKKKGKKQARKDKSLNRKRLKKNLDIPNLWPWKEEMLKKRLARMKETDAEEERNKQVNRKRQLKKSREKMLLKAVQGSGMETEQQKPAESKPTGQKFFRRELFRVIEQCDVVIEVLDARDPLACRCHSIEQKIISMKSNVTSGNKKLILLLNKIDLVPSDVLKEWIRILRREFPVIAFKCNTQNQKSNLSQSKANFKKGITTSQSVGSDALLQLLKNYSRSLNLKTNLSIGFVGYPNTGKSSVINSLKRSRAVGTSSTPGFTRDIQEVRLDSHIKLIDSPGVLLNENDNSVGLVLKNAVRVDQVDGQIAVNSVLERCDSNVLMQVYQIAEFSNTEEFLFLVAKKSGKLKKGGVPDLEQAARLVLQDWNGGKIPFYMQPPKQENDDDEISFATSFSSKFDIDALLRKNHGAAVTTMKECNTGKTFVQLKSRSEKDDQEMADAEMV